MRTELSEQTTRHLESALAGGGGGDQAGCEEDEEGEEGAPASAPEEGGEEGAHAGAPPVRAGGGHRKRWRGGGVVQYISIVRGLDATCRHSLDYA